MYVLLGLFVIIAAFVYLKSPGMGTLPRILVAAITFIVPTGAVLLAIIYIQDPPPECSGAYNPQTKVMGPPDYCDPPPPWWTKEREIAEWEACRKSVDTCIPSAEWDARIERLKKTSPNTIAVASESLPT